MADVPADRPSPAEQVEMRQHAKDHFLRATCALLDTVDREAHAAAMLHAACGLLLLAKSDPDERGLHRAEEIVQGLRGGT